MTMAQDGAKVPYASAVFTPRKYSWYMTTAQDGGKVNGEVNIGHENTTLVIMDL
jgi:hypothetical protein